jgi:hypothetical protein
MPTPLSAGKKPNSTCRNLQMQSHPVDLDVTRFRSTRDAPYKWEGGA